MTLPGRRGPVSEGNDQGLAVVASRCCETRPPLRLRPRKVFRRDVLAKVLTEARAAALVDELITWPLFVASVAPLLREAWTLRNNITIHDAVYVALTRELEGAVLVTTDASLSRAPASASRR